MYEGCCGGLVGYNLKPGKVSIDFGEYFSFSKVLDFYEKCGGEFDEEVATSQPVKELIPTGKDSNIIQVYKKVMDILGKYDNVSNICADNGKVLFMVDGKHYKISCNLQK